MFVLLASSDYNSVASDNHSTLSRLPHSSTLSCRPVWITAIQFSPGRRRSLQTGCNECWTLPRALSVTLRNSTAICRDSSIPSCNWLDVPERVQYKLGVLMYRRQHNQAPRYLTDHCRHCFPSAPVFGQQSSLRPTLPALRVRPSGFFCCWSDGLELTGHCPKPCGIRSVLWTCSYRQSLKTFLLSQYYCVQRIRGLLR